VSTISLAVTYFNILKGQLVTPAFEVEADRQEWAVDLDGSVPDKLSTCLTQQIDVSISSRFYNLYVGEDDLTVIESGFDHANWKFSQITI